MFPVTVVDPVKDAVEADYRPRNAIDEENYRLYTSPDAYGHALVGLQVVCQRFDDEKVLRCMELIENATRRE